MAAEFSTLPRRQDRFDSATGKGRAKDVVVDVTLRVAHLSRVYSGKGVERWQRVQNSEQCEYLGITGDLPDGLEEGFKYYAITRIRPHGRETICRFDSLGSWRDQSQMGGTHLLLASHIYGVIILQVTDDNEDIDDDNRKEEGADIDVQEM